MNDFTALGTVFVCMLGTLGLIRACEWLRPRDASRVDSTAGGVTKEAPR